MGSAATSPKVLDYLYRNANVHVHAMDIVRDTGLTLLQVQGAIGNLRRTKGMDIETIIAGQVFVLHTKNEAAKVNGKRVFEELGTTKDGRLIIQDADGNLFEAKEM